MEDLAALIESCSEYCAFLDRRGRVISDEFFVFIPIDLFEIERWGSSVGSGEWEQVGD